MAKAANTMILVEPSLRSSAMQCTRPSVANRWHASDSWVMVVCVCDCGRCRCRFEDNLRFFRDQQIYTTEHFAFFADFMQAAVPLVKPALEYTVAVRTRSSSIVDTDEASQDTSLQLDARIIDLGTKFWLDTLSHAAVRVTWMLDLLHVMASRCCCRSGQ